MFDYVYVSLGLAESLRALFLVVLILQPARQLRFFIFIFIFFSFFFCVNGNTNEDVHKLLVACVRMACMQDH